jgi:Ca-activated chloride channel family protein
MIPLFAGTMPMLLVLATVACAGEVPLAATAALTEQVTQGALRMTQQDGSVVECPLKHTDVKATVSGFIARVRVTQTFYNPLDEKIEAVYVFPLPHESAVDEMTMVIGERRIVGLIKRRAEARSIYENAIAAGQTAALLEQERPNIFVQSVGNIPPKQEVKIEISYVDVLAYDMGVYEFHFPMVVGPRYNPLYRWRRRGAARAGRRVGPARGSALPQAR